MYKLINKKKTGISTKMSVKNGLVARWTRDKINKNVTLVENVVIGI